MSAVLAHGRFIFRDAGPADDGLLRQILRATPLPGWVTLCYEREPEYVSGCAVEGDTRTVLASTPEGVPVGFFSRAVRPAWIGGRPTRLGYLGQLRLLPEWRRRSRAVLHGFQVCRQLLEDGRQDTPYYLTSILEDNLPARRLLTSGIQGLPSYLPLGGYLSLVAATAQPWSRRRPTAPHVLRPATDSDLPLLAALLQASGRGYALHPWWDVTSLDALRPVGWHPRDCLLLLNGERPVACGAVWDQRCVRQWRVAAYAPPLAGLRAVASTALGLAGYPRLPPPGRLLEQGFISHLAVLPGEEPALPILVAALLRLARQRRLGSVVLGLSDGHPWLPLLNGLRALRYRSRLYLVHWREGREAAQRLLAQPIQTEAACL